MEKEIKRERVDKGISRDNFMRPRGAPLSALDLPSLLSLEVCISILWVGMLDHIVCDRKGHRFSSPEELNLNALLINAKG